MRVIAGKCKSLNLITPKGDNTRPTQDRIKETLFNILMPYLPYSTFIDIFAGSGGMGIEALSRGASKAFFIDNNKEALRCIETNLEFTRLKQSANVLRGDFANCLSMINIEHADIIFADPPYNGGFEERLFEVLGTMQYVDEDTIIVLEAAIDKNFSFDNFEIVRVKEYKTNKHIFLRRSYE